jgi:secreted trypsin-like serine protease
LFVFFVINSAYDSGSPIIVPGDTFEDDILVALVSWGEECADAQFPGTVIFCFVSRGCIVTIFTNLFPFRNYFFAS